MRKLWAIAVKDLYIRVTDRGALLFLLALPLVIIAIMGFAFGRADGDAPFRAKVLVLNLDGPLNPALFGAGESLASFDPAVSAALGAAAPSLQRSLTLTNSTFSVGSTLADLLLSDSFSTLLDAVLVTDEAAARHTVAQGDGCCLVILPPGLTDGLLMARPVTVTLVTDPAATIGPQIVGSIVTQLVEQFAGSSSAVNLGLTQLVAANVATPDELVGGLLGLFDRFQNNGIAIFAPDAGELGTGGAGGGVVEVQLLNRRDQVVAFDPAAFFAPAMAIIFVAFGATMGVRSLLDEKERGTLGRLNAAPIRPGEILGGKLLAVVITAGTQLALLLVGTALIFGIDWGNPPAVALFGLLVVLTFTSLGLLLAVVARTGGQAATYANAIILIGAVLGGNLAPIDQYPQWLQGVARLTPNYWSAQGLGKLAGSGTLASIQPELLALSLMSALMMGGGLLLYRRRMAG
jgi:ABC-2 type transport system permease protein